MNAKMRNVQQKLLLNAMIIFWAIMGVLRNGAKIL